MGQWGSGAARKLGSSWPGGKHCPVTPNLSGLEMALGISVPGGLAGGSELTHTMGPDFLSGRRQLYSRSPWVALWVTHRTYLRGEGGHRLEWGLNCGNEVRGAGRKAYLHLWTLMIP